MSQITNKSKFIILSLAITGLLLIFSNSSATAIPKHDLPAYSITGVNDEFIYLPIITNNFDTSLGTPIFGTQVYSDTDADSYYIALQESNATWLRTRLHWNNAEPIPGSYNWTLIDSTLVHARNDMGGYKIIATIEFAPSWAADHSLDPIYPDRLDEFADFMQALVERYDGDGIDDAPGSPVVLYWEMYNEPDRNVWWGYDGDQFANMLKQVYPAIKSANPQAMVVFPGLAYDYFDDQGGPFIRSFLPDVLANGAGDYFDIMNFHSYPAFTLNWAQNSGPGLLEKAAAIRSLMNTYNVQKPMIVTETGWHSNDIGTGIPGSQEVQARYVVELFTQSMAADVDVTIWWMLYDLGTYESGLLTTTIPPIKKTSFTTFQKAIDEFSTAHFVRKFSDAETGDTKMEVYEFEDFVHRRDIYVAWMNPVDTNVTKSLKITASQATIRNGVTGNIIKSVADGDDGQVDGRITVIVEANPIYIEVGK